MVLKYAHGAAAHAKSVVELIKNKLAEDQEKRSAGKVDEIGLAFAFQKQTILTKRMDEVEVIRQAGIGPGVKNLSLKDKNDDEEMEVVELDSGVAEMIRSIRNQNSAAEKQESSSSDDSSSEDEAAVEVVQEVTAADKKKNIAQVNLDDSEEEETVQVGGEDLSSNNKSKKGKKQKA